MLRRLLCILDDAGSRLAGGDFANFSLILTLSPNFKGLPRPCRKFPETFDNFIQIPDENRTFFV